VPQSTAAGAKVELWLDLLTDAGTGSSADPATIHEAFSTGYKATVLSKSTTWAASWTPGATFPPDHVDAAPVSGQGGLDGLVSFAYVRPVTKATLAVSGYLGAACDGQQKLTQAGVIYTLIPSCEWLIDPATCKPVEPDVDTKTGLCTWTLAGYHVVPASNKERSHYTARQVAVDESAFLSLAPQFARHVAPIKAGLVTLPPSLEFADGAKVPVELTEAEFHAQVGPVKPTPVPPCNPGQP